MYAKLDGDGQIRWLDGAATAKKELEEDYTDGDFIGKNVRRLDAPGEVDEELDERRLRLRMRAPQEIDARRSGRRHAFHQRVLGPHEGDRIQRHFGQQVLVLVPHRRDVALPRPLREPLYYDETRFASYLEQLGRLPAYSSFGAYTTEPTIRLAERLAALSRQVRAEGGAGSAADRVEAIARAG